MTMPITTLLTIIRVIVVPGFVVLRLAWCIQIVSVDLVMQRNVSGREGSEQESHRLVHGGNRRRSGRASPTSSFRHRRSSGGSTNIFSRSNSFSSTESLGGLGVGPDTAESNKPYTTSPTRSLRGGTRTISLGGASSTSSTTTGGQQISFGSTQSMKHSLLKVRHEAKRRQERRQGRLRLCLIGYITCVTVYLLVALRRLQKSDLSARQDENKSNTPLSRRSLPLSRGVAKLGDLLLRRSSQTEPFTNNGVSLYPPPFPIVTRDPTIPLSSDALKMCTQTLWHTVETTTIVLPHGETFIHTGDIDDLWLRDSAAQVHPLLIPAFQGRALIALDPKLDRIVSGLIKRTSTYIRHDPYANAFRIDDSYKFSEEQKKMGRHDLISTWNYELDSACYYMRLLYYYWKQSPNGHSPDSVVRLQSVEEAVEIMVDLWIAEQRHEDDHYPVGKLLDCLNCNKPYRYPGLPRQGKGSPTNATAGMTWTGFRPSDDECQYGYLVPANMFAVVVLEYMVDLAQQVWHNPVLATKASRLASEINQGILDHAIVHHPEFGRIYAYEVDGFGNSNLMDDANIPSLQSIPYLGYRYDPDIYENTRRFIFSPANPEYRRGSNSLTGDIEGYGSPHMEAAIHDNIWPMSIAMRGLTSDSVEDKVRWVEQLVHASAGTLWMHESFDAHNPAKFTRSWFCWSDSLFAELVLSLTDACPHSDYKYHVLEWRDPVHVPGGKFSAQ